MAPSYHPLERSERLIALGRAVLAGFALLAVWLDPTSPARHVGATYALLSAALRWSWRGVLWTAAATLAAFLGLGAYAQWVLHGPAFELNGFILRAVHLVTVALLLGYLSAHQQRLREELARLAAFAVDKLAERWRADADAARAKRRQKDRRAHRR